VQSDLKSKLGEVEVEKNMLFDESVRLRKLIEQVVRQNEKMKV
jgi:hypothetical protein